MKVKKNTMLLVFIGLLTIIILIEVYLRTYWGFCDSVLMMESKNYEYIEQPNQNRFRFRHHVFYNSFSMRSPEPDTNVYTILGFGDSVINGGVMVDQDSLATTIMSDELTKQLHKKVQVLNVGAGSWGPDNAYAYLEEKGNFNAKVIFLVVSSHDAYDNMDFMPVLDKVNRYESKQYNLALWELWVKYIWPRLKDNLKTEETEVFKRGKIFNSGFPHFYQYCKSRGLPFYIYLNPDKTELIAHRYNQQGQEIIKFCKDNSIEVIEGIETTKLEDYRGIIHMNNQGQRHMANAIKNVILSKVITKVESDKNHFSPQYNSTLKVKF